MIPSPDSPPTDVYADSAWKHGNPLDLSRVRLMITSEEPEEGDYLGSFVLAVDRGHHKKQYYWIPDWPRSEAGNRTRTEFFILCRLVTVTRRQSAPIQPFVGGQTVGQPGQNFNSPENSIRSANSPPPATAPTTLPDDRK